MPQIIDRDIEKRLLSASQKIEEINSRKEEEPTEPWKDLQLPFTLENGLSRLTKDELTSIRRRLDVKKASSLKKADLISLFIEVIPTKVEDVFSIWDQERMKIVNGLINNDGVLPATDIDLKVVEHLCLTGFVFSGTYDGEKILALPSDLFDVILETEVNENIREKAKRNTEWIRLTHGLLYYYGTLKLERLLQFMEAHLSEPINKKEFSEVINEAIHYYEECEITQSEFTHFKVADSERVLHEQQARIGLDYFPFTKDQLWNAGARDYVDRNQSYRQFVKFLTKRFNMNRLDADQLAEECVLIIQNGIGPNEMLEILQHHLECSTVEAMDDLMKLIVELINNTRQPFLKGFTSRELADKMQVKSTSSSSKESVTDLVKQTQIGRNDPCTCGSGKKFKKCCGK